MEENYDFRNRLQEVHKKGMRDDSVWREINGCVVNEAWEIVYPGIIDRVISYAAQDLQEYFAVSQNVHISLRETSNISEEYKKPENKIILTLADLTPGSAPEYSEPAAFRLNAENGIIICGNTSRGTAQGCYSLENSMNLNRGPVIEYCDISKKPLFSPRMVHSGYAMDVFPDEHLKAIAHSGMDAILIFTKGVNQTPCGYVDFNDLIYRAEGFGIDVYAYSYYISEKHPDEPDAREHYESTYGQLFKSCPGLRGVVLVGESMEFPSKDPHTTGRPYYEKTPENNPEGKPSPGWYPCYDYPQWLELIKSVIRDKKPDADIVFWTYNWGYVEEEARLKLIRALPTDISLQATFEMFEKFKISDKVTEKCTDYTLSFEGPGKYFESEAREAKKRGIRLYTMCNTGGLTWDLGVIPYEPAPYQWQRRYDGLLRAHREWGLCGLMESHHFGFWPSFVSELAKNAFWEPSCDGEQMMRKIAARDFGDNNTEKILKVWQYYSDGIRKYISTDEDQYGPFRIGPSYPLLFLKDVILQSPPGAHFGNNKICNPMYGYDMSQIDKLNYEIQSLSEMRDLYHEGNKLLKTVTDSVSGRYLSETEHLLNLGRFIENSVITVINVKQWYILKRKLLPNYSRDSIWAGGTPQLREKNINETRLSVGDMEHIISEMKKIADREIENAKRTIPLVEFDSRLGFEPSMEYMCDREHLEWKIEKTRDAVAELENMLKAASAEA